MDLVENLMDAVSCGDENLINFYIQMGINISTVCSSDGSGVLHWASASSEGEKIVPFLILKGANLNSSDKNGFSPLHYHALRGRSFGVSSLLHAGASKDLKTIKEEYTPLHLAVLHQYNEVVNILLAYDVDVTAMTKDGKTIYDMGWKQGVYGINSPIIDIVKKNQEKYINNINNKQLNSSSSSSSSSISSSTTTNNNNDDITPSIIDINTNIF